MLSHSASAITRDAAAVSSYEPQAAATLLDRADLSDAYARTVALAAIDPEQVRDDRRCVGTAVRFLPVPSISIGSSAALAAEPAALASNPGRVIARPLARGSAHEGAGTNSRRRLRARLVTRSPDSRYARMERGRSRRQRSQERWSERPRGSGSHGESARVAPIALRGDPSRAHRSGSVCTAGHVRQLVLKSGLPAKVVRDIRGRFVLLWRREKTLSARRGIAWDSDEKHEEIPASMPGAQPSSSGASPRAPKWISGT